MSGLHELAGALSARLPPTDRLEQTADAALKILSSWFPHGTDVFDEEWDVLVILDTCRADAMDEMATEYDFVASGTSVWSRGSATREWVPHTFDQSNLDEIRDTALVTANPTSRWGLGHESQPEWPEFTKRLTRWDTVDPDDFLEFDEVWQYGPRNPFSGTVMPYAVTDRAISVWRSASPDRMIVHYLPPHKPYGAKALRENRALNDVERSPWKALREGTPREAVWDRYLDELEFGLDSVRTLVEDIDAERIVITSDHGEAFGEFGVYAHPMIPIPQLREVPWVETTGQGRDEYTPVLEPASGNDAVEADVEEQLELLGYR
ncbi:hypothetical protein ABNG02_03115 [Halorubrum ejinorense]|uniref:Sulfatase n=1 Tax=Halorubrum ejinorense TaxID=425309 RepID=A0AAV3SWK2_9EURY